MGTTASTACSCGYENNPEYSYCGLCGSSLRRPTESQVGAPVTYSQPPFAVDEITIRKMQEETVPQEAVVSQREQQEAKKNTEASHHPGNLVKKKAARPSYWRLHLTLAFLLITAGALVRRWQNDGFPWNKVTQIQQQTSIPATFQPSGDQPSTSDQTTASTSQP